MVRFPLGNCSMLEGKAITIQAWTDYEGSRRSKLPDFLDSWLTNVASLSALITGRLDVPGNIPGTYFCSRLSRPQGHSVARNGRDPIGNRSCYLPATSAVHSPTAPPRTPPPDNMYRNETNTYPTMAGKMN